MITFYQTVALIAASVYHTFIALKLLKLSDFCPFLRISIISVVHYFIQFNNFKYSKSERSGKKAV